MGLIRPNSLINELRFPMTEDLRYEDGDVRVPGGVELRLEGGGDVGDSPPPKLGE